MQALARDSGKCAQPFEANSRIDKISQDGFANCLPAVEIRIDRFRKQRLSESTSRSARAYVVSLKSLVNPILVSIAQFVSALVLRFLYKAHRSLSVEDSGRRSDGTGPVW